MIGAIKATGLTCLPARKQPFLSRQGRTGSVFVKAERQNERNYMEMSMILGLASLGIADKVMAAESSVDEAVSSAVTAVQKGGDAVSTGIEYATKAAGAAKQAYDVAAPVVKDVYTKVAPVVEKGVKTTAEVVGPAVEKGLPIVKQSLSNLITSSGVDTGKIQKTTSVASDAAGKAVSIASPTVSKAVDFVSTSDPITLVKYGLVVGATYLLLPYLLGGLGGVIRGYAGDISATQALDQIMNDGKSYLLDIRTVREKESSGVPDVPGSASGRFIEVPFASTDDRRLRGMLKNAQGVEQQITAMLIASMKRIDKGCSLFLMDKNGGISKAIAKELNSLGFGKAYVVSGGFEGWNRCKLQTKPSSSVQVIQPGFGTLSVPRRALPK
eukprot:TRINITY_DN3502_c0_g1_i1.p1 TRINITY_DN3502_c0_g1~~TRINITY_DN3502_c0_g1_i1.p1  ORF type:complete len:429 (-),score=84.72 TRINITY_DN3502_c0_g1_i1:297-1448(-)